MRRVVDAARSSGVEPAQLKRLRAARGRSLQEVADAAGITPAFLARLESGCRPIRSRHVLHRLAAALDVTLAELAGGPSPLDVREVPIAFAALTVTLGGRLAADLAACPGPGPEGRCPSCPVPDDPGGAPAAPGRCTFADLGAALLALDPLLGRAPGGER
ncbi:hypothetical protein BJF78_09310 [Pseudonocardia sp. CNS-139]|nr:hypothetical protein BJF78_09310 [Pseudonocardia sp. CNS-139]